MPKQNIETGINLPVSFRPGKLQRERLTELVETRQQNQSSVLNAAIDLLWLFDIGSPVLEALKENNQ